MSSAALVAFLGLVPQVIFNFRYICLLPEVVFTFLISFFINSHQAVTGVSPAILPLAMSFASVNSALTYRDGGKQTSLDYDQLVNILYEGQKTTFLAHF